MPRIERSADVSWEGNAARGQGLITFEDHVLVIKDWRALSEAGEFKPAYLHLEDHAAA